MLLTISMRKIRNLIEIDAKTKTQHVHRENDLEAYSDEEYLQWHNNISYDEQQYMEMLWLSPVLIGLLGLASPKILKYASIGIYLFGKIPTTSHYSILYEHFLYSQRQ
jgi:hypothetical protein